MPSFSIKICSNQNEHANKSKRWGLHNHPVRYKRNESPKREECLSFLSTTRHICLMVFHSAHTHTHTYIDTQSHSHLFIITKRVVASAFRGCFPIRSRACVGESPHTRFRQTWTSSHAVVYWKSCWKHTHTHTHTQTESERHVAILGFGASTLFTFGLLKIDTARWHCVWPCRVVGSSLPSSPVRAKPHLHRRTFIVIAMCVSLAKNRNRRSEVYVGVIDLKYFILN